MILWFFYLNFFLSLFFLLLSTWREIVLRSASIVSHFLLRPAPNSWPTSISQEGEKRKKKTSKKIDIYNQFVRLFLQSRRITFPVTWLVPAQMSQSPAIQTDPDWFKSLQSRCVTRDDGNGDGISISSISISISISRSSSSSNNNNNNNKTQSICQIIGGEGRRKRRHGFVD